MLVRTCTDVIFGESQGYPPYRGQGLVQVLWKAHPENVIREKPVCSLASLQPAPTHSLAHSRQLPLMCIYVGYGFSKELEEARLGTQLLRLIVRAETAKYTSLYQEPS